MRRRCEACGLPTGDGNGGTIGCAFPAAAYVKNDIGTMGWYCEGHACLFAEQAARRAAIWTWLHARPWVLPAIAMLSLALVTLAFGLH
jgi:hypothetical protein